MAKKVAKGQLTVVSLNDGLSSYMHRAWSNSSDGTKDFTTKFKEGLRYIGTYTSNSQQPSSNPKDYDWTPLFDNVVVGQRNLISNGAKYRESKAGDYAFGGNYYFGKSGNHRFFLEVGKTYTLTAKALVPKGTSIGIILQKPDKYDYSETLWFKEGESGVKSITFTIPSTIPNGFVSTLDPFDMKKMGGCKVEWAVLTEGNVPATDWFPAPEEVNNRLDNIKIGGRNLLVEKLANIGSYINNVGQIVKWNQTKIYDKGIKLDGEEYLTFQFWNDKNIKQEDMASRVNFFNGEGKFISQTDKLNVTNGYGIFRVPIPKDSITAKLHAPNINAKYKLELGSIPTGWSPSPEDVEFDIEDKVDGIKIGGRNKIIAKDTIDKTYIDEAGLLASGAESFSTDYIKVEPLEHITFSQRPYTSSYSRIAYFDSSKKFVRRDLLRGETHSIVVPSNVAYIRWSPDSYDGKYKEGYQIETGNKPTAWTPAPEDLSNSIKEVSNDISNQKIGGRNLLMNSESPKFLGYQGATVVYETDVPVKEWSATNALRHKIKGGNSTIAGLLAGGIQSTLKDNTEYIHSMYIKNIGQKKFSLSANGGKDFEIEPNTSQRVVIKHYHYTNLSSMQFVIKRVAQSDEIDFITWHGQIEEGNMLTDWTPAPEDINLKVDNIKVGGRNLLPMTKTIGVNTGRYGEVIDEQLVDGFSVVKTAISKDTVSYRDTYLARSIHNLTGTEYTLSFWAKANKDTTASCYFYSPNTTTLSVSNQGARSSAVDGATLLKVGTEWEKYWIKWRQTSTDARKEVIIGRLFDMTAQLYITQIQLEEGNMVTDWTAAPEDIDARLDNMQVGGRNLLRDAGNPETVYMASNDQSKYPKAREFLEEGGRRFTRIRRTDLSKLPNTFSMYSSIDVSKLTVDIKKLEGVTVSFKARAPRPVKFSMMVIDTPRDKEENTLIKGQHGSVIDIGTVWKTYSFYIPNPVGTHLRVNPINAASGFNLGDLSTFYLDIADYKVEEGNIATAFSLAPEDLSDKVDNMSVGGRNLWVESDTQAGYTTAGGEIGTSTTNHMAMKSLIDVEPNDTLLLQIWNPKRVVNKGNSNRFSFFDSGGKWINNSFNIMLTGEPYEFHKIKVPENGNKVRLAVIKGLNTADESIKIKVEKGTMPTDWTPAPEDMIHADLTNTKYIAEVEETAKKISTKLTQTESVVGGLNTRFSKQEQTAAEISKTVTSMKNDIVQVGSRVSQTEKNISGAVKSGQNYGGFEITANGAKLDTPNMSVNIDNKEGFKVTKKSSPAKTVLQVNTNGQMIINGGAGQAWSNSPDGSVDFTTTYPRENYVGGSHVSINKVGTSASFSQSPYNVIEWAGKQVTVSCYVSVKNAKKLQDGRARIGTEISLQRKNGVYVYAGAWKHLADGESFSGWIQNTVYVPNDINAQSLTNLGGMYIQTNGDEMIVEKAKYEIGTGRTLWTGHKYESTYILPMGYVGQANGSSDSYKDYRWSKNPDKIEIHQAWSNSPDGLVDFTTTKPNENTFSIKEAKFGTLVDGVMPVVEPSLVSAFNFTGAKSGNGSFRINDVITRDGDWTISFKVRGTQGFAITFGIDVCDSANQKLTINSNGRNEWEYKELTFKNIKSTNVYNFIDFNAISWHYFHIKEFKVEHGSKATPFIESPKDNLEGSVMKYIGQSGFYSTKPSDYRWTRNPESPSMYRAWSNSPDGSEGFVKKYPAENNLRIEDDILNKRTTANGLGMTKTPTANGVALSFSGAKQYSYIWYFSAFGNVLNGVGKSVSVGDIYTVAFDMSTNRNLIQQGITFSSSMNEAEIIYHNFVQETVEQASRKTVRIYCVVKITAVNPNSNHNLHFQSNFAAASPAWNVNLSNLSIQSGDFRGGMYLQSKEDEYTESMPKYIGVSNIYNGNYYDYRWEVNPEYASALNREALSEKIGVNEYSNDIGQIHNDINNKAGLSELEAIENITKNLASKYEDFIKDGGVYSRDLAELEKRSAALIANMGNQIAKYEFITKYITMGNEGLLIGDSTSSMKILMSHEKISFIDGGQEIAYMQGQEFKINRGTILESLQVGNHRMEQLDKNNTVFKFIK